MASFAKYYDSSGALLLQVDTFPLVTDSGGQYIQLLQWSGLVGGGSVAYVDFDITFYVPYGGSEILTVWPKGGDTTAVLGSYAFSGGYFEGAVDASHPLAFGAHHLTGRYVAHLSGGPVLIRFQSNNPISLIPFCHTGCGKDISARYKELLGQVPTGRVLLYKITRTDGRVFSYTSYMEDVDGNTLKRDGVTEPECAGVTFVAKTGIAPSSIRSSLTLTPDNMEIEAIFDDDEIKSEEIEAGMFDDAEVMLMEFNYLDRNAGIMRHKRGNIGQISWGTDKFTAELRSLSQRLSQNIIELTGTMCRVHQFGDYRCKKNLNGVSADGFDLTKNGTVTAVDAGNPCLILESSALESYPSNRFFTGRFKVTNPSSPNYNLERKIKSSAGSKLVLSQPMPYPMAVGDTFRAICGCDRTVGMCGNTYSNVVNFRGEPNSPGPKIFEKGK